jgi:uncharacterized protein YndB with AHSA1/START domain
MEQPAIEYTIYIAADADTVWRAIVGDEGNRAYMFGAVLRSELTVGSDYRYVGPGQDGDETVHVYGEVLAVEPGVTLSLSEHPGPSYRENHAELRSRMTWTLSSAGDDVTKLHFVNDEWSADHPSYSDTQDTWPMTLSSLKSFVETGKALPFSW